MEEINDQSNVENAKIRGLIIGFLIGAALMGIVFGAIKAVEYFQSKNDLIGEKENSKIREITGNIDKYFYKYSDDVTTDNISEGIYRGILDSLDDPYSEYYSAEELKAELNDNEGISFGIGCYVTIDEETELPMIAGVFEQSPAEEADIREGDIIYKVDGEPTTGLSLSQVVSRIKGLEGTTVHLTIYREGESDYLELDVKRGKLIETTTVEWGTLISDPDIGYIRIKEFSEITVDQFNEAMVDLRAENIKGLIIDLRNNFGGSLDACVDIARRILPEGVVVYTENKNGKKDNYTCDGKYELELPLVVLTNEYSASASEILAGAIQDYKKGTLVGTTTFGKGIVQRIIPLSDGSAMKITISAYFTPSGRNIQGVGIAPDVEIDLDYDAARDKGEDNQVNKAVEVLRKEIGK